MLARTRAGLVVARALRTIDRSQDLGLRMMRQPPHKQLDYYYSKLLGKDWQQQMEQVRRRVCVCGAAGVHTCAARGAPRARVGRHTPEGPRASRVPCSLDGRTPPRVTHHTARTGLCGGGGRGGRWLHHRRHGEARGVQPTAGPPHRLDCSLLSPCMQRPRHATRARHTLTTRSRAHGKHAHARAGARQARHAGGHHAAL
jgi:hypothetical protein